MPVMAAANTGPTAAATAKSSVKQTTKPVSKKREEELRRQRLRAARQQLKQDDKEIRKLEKRLRLNRRKGRKAIPQSFYADGLGDILDFIDKRAEADDDLKQEQETAAVEQEPRSDDEEPIDDPSGSDDDGPDDQDDDDDEVDDNASDDEEIDGEPANEEVDEEEEVAQQEDEPASAADAPQPLDEMLLRRIRGQLNRITSSNLPSICTFIEALYRDHSLWQVNECICRCIHSLIVIDVSMSPPQLVSEVCLLLAALHGNVGEEVGGHALHFFAHSLDAELQSRRDLEDKRLDNSLAIVCNLFAAGLADPVLMFDIACRILTIFDEKSIELLLFLLTSVGFLMRKDAPDRMKQLIQEIHTKASSCGDGSHSKRAEFMLETLADVRNNNLLRVTSRATSVIQPLDRDAMKSMLRPCLKNATKISFIPGSLSQALASNRWWIKVGPGLIEERVNREDQSSAAVQQQLSQFCLDTDLEERLCRRLRLNTTPLRRSLFKAVVSASDYVEAGDRLVSLCRRSNCSDAAHVVLQIALHEGRTLNKFYVHVLKRFSQCDRRCKVAVFHALRQRVMDAESLSGKQCDILAHLVFQLLREQVISLAVLKSLDFAELTPTLVSWLQQLMSLILAQEELDMQQMFERIPKKEHTLLTSLRLFISCFMQESGESATKEALMAGIQLKLKRV